MRWYRKYKSPIGNLMLVTDGEALTGLLLEKEVEVLDIAATGWIELPKADENRMSESILGQRGAREILEFAGNWLDRYFAGEKMPPPAIVESAPAHVYEYKINIDENNILLRPEGTEFRREVWRLLCQIPYGQVVTYGDLAKRMAAIRGKKKMSAQAVGGAVGNNPIAIMIPCHRVIGEGNKLVGFGGGLPAKVQLLETEGIHGIKKD